MLWIVKAFSSWPWKSETINKCTFIKLFCVSFWIESFPIARFKKLNDILLRKYIHAVWWMLTASPSSFYIQIKIRICLCSYKIFVSYLCVCLCRSWAINSHGIQLIHKEPSEWSLCIALIYTFMWVTLVLPPMWITFVRSTTQRARLCRFQVYSILSCRVTVLNKLKC